MTGKKQAVKMKINPKINHKR